MRRLAAGDGTVDVVADQVGSPTYVGDLVDALLEVADGVIREPVLHAANEGEASRFEQAQAVFEAVGADPARVRPVGSDRHPAPRAAAAVLGAVRQAVDRGGADPAAAVARGVGRGAHWRYATTGRLTSTP